MQYDYGKVFIAFSAIVTGIVLILTGDHTGGVALVTLVLGYTMGNGRLISNNQNPQPMISRKGTSTGSRVDTTSADAPAGPDGP